MVNAALERFMSKIDCSDGCWLWRGGLNNRGYPIFRVGGRGTPLLLSSRFIWQARHGALPTKARLKRTCKQKLCVRPEHHHPWIPKEYSFNSTFEARFWAKVQKKGADECWPWLAGTNDEGYGLIRTDGDAAVGPKILAHVAAYLLSGRTIVGNEVVRHGCDYRLCCNPRHLSTGTYRDNALDSVKRGRHARAGGRRKV